MQTTITNSKIKSALFYYEIRINKNHYKIEKLKQQIANNIFARF